jgi:phenylpropionate dioxygenase-like ring-hydroxylating dioxygenase large terminal subunit
MAKDSEMKRIRPKSWLYVAHESEIPNAGDFKSLTLAQQPVIVVRDDEGQVRVLLNICRHRKVTVCRQEKGNAAYFICIDHGWVYNTKGNLVGLSGPNRLFRSFTERRGLTPVPRVDIHQGVIFASLSPEGESLEEYLRESRFFAKMSETRRNV